MNVAGASDIEPELRLAPPRRVRVRFRVRVGRWLLTLMAVALPGLLVAVACQWGAKVQALRKHGVETTGHVVDARQAKGDSLPTIDYRYEVAGHPYDGSHSVLPEFFGTVKAGDAVNVTYRSDEPQVSRLTEDLQQRGSSDVLIVWAAVPVLLAICGWAWWHNGRWIRKVVRLSTIGAPVRTTSMTLKPVLAMMIQKYVVVYRYEVGDRYFDITEPYLPSMRDPLKTPGTQATVLYDPNNPSDHVLYPTAVRLVHISAAEDRS
ncbi:MAG TPA: DUF3592 domain-containing protein [Pirellulales bacterium]|jgi:hypothetical protein|nr:DUF3592 domain-containing protein [Pirellulales bacterium]